MPQTLQITVLLASTALVVCLLLMATILNRLFRTYGRKSSKFVTASASTNLSKKLRPLVGPGVEILMPGGHGTYPLALSLRARRKWEDQIRDWVGRGAQFNVIVTSPNSAAAAYWQALVERSPPGLKVHFLDRKLASAEDAVEIERLDTYHPVLVVKDGEPLGMWLEGCHEEGSAVAYNVEWVAAEDVVGFQRARFSRLLTVLRGLLDETRGPAHLKRLMPSAGRSQAADSKLAA